MSDTGLALAREGAERAASGLGDQWKQDALDAFKDFADRGVEFSTEDVRRANPALDRIPEKRAWGAVAQKAVRDGIVIKVGITRDKLPHVHAAYHSLWRKA